MKKYQFFTSQIALGFCKEEQNISYLDIGFGPDLTRIGDTPSQDLTQLDPQSFENLTDIISGSKIQGGVISSPDGKTKFDLESGTFKVNNGVEDLVTLGILPDGDIGLLIKDGVGHTLVHISENKQLIQSPNEHFLIDFIREHILSKDDKAIARALFGKGDF